MNKLREYIIIFCSIGFFGYVLAEDSNITQDQTIQSTGTQTNTNNNNSVINQTTNSTSNINQVSSSTVNSTSNSTSTSSSVIDQTQTINSTINQNQSIDNTINQNSVSSINQVNQSDINQVSSSVISTDNTNNNFNNSVSESSIKTENVNQNNSENLNRNFNDSTQRVKQDIKSPPPSAISPTFSPSYSQDLCTTGASAAVQTQIFGVSAGKSVRDENCERLKLSKGLYDMGMRVAAVALLCEDSRVYRSMAQAGTPCPYKGKIGEEARIAWEENPQDRPDWELIKHEYNHNNYEIKAYKKEKFCRIPKYKKHKLCLD